MQLALEVDTTTITPSRVLLFVVVLAAIGIYWLWQREQSKKWATWAAAHGLQHFAKTESAGHFRFIKGVDKGEDHHQQNYAHGTLQGHHVEVCSYAYKTELPSDDEKGVKRSHWHGLAILRLDGMFPELTINSENALKRVGHTVTGSDIDFESLEFSRAYEVKSKDERFAYDFCNARMIELLLANRGLRVEVEGEWLGLIQKGKLRLDEVDQTLSQLIAIRNHMPTYLFNSTDERP